uniref:Myb/SANT-like DNA-binding domain-containing protein n=1 Tax=Amphimedon queenslandica TaxID=400682 RepID=A0A1X7UP62_AMPQE
MAGGWTEVETCALIDVWGDADVQHQLDSVSRNRHIYEKISTDLNNLGYHKTWQQCKTKVKNLTQRYRKLRDGHCVTGTGRSEWHLYDKIDAILGTRVSSDPPLVLDSGALEASIITDMTEPEVSPFDEHNDSGNSRSTSVENNITEETSTEQETTIDSHPETTSDEATSIVMTPPVTTKKKRVRKPNKGDLLTNLLKFEEDLEKREIEREEKRLKLEIEREEKRRQIMLEV